MEIKGLLSVDGGLLCKKEVLSKHYQTEINGISIEIVFPGIPVSEFDNTMNYVGTSNPLMPPEKGKNIKCGGEKVFWGYPMQYPAYNSFVEHILLLSECEETDISEVAQKLYSAIGKWEIAFTSFCKLCTKQQMARDKNENVPRNLVLLSSNGYVQNQQPVFLCGQLHGDDEFLSDEQVKQAIAFASSGKELFLEYQMLLSAYVARKECKNRQAIIDACSAVEICLVNRIKSFCAGKGIEPNLFLEKYRSLGDRFKLAINIDEHFPVSDYSKIIVSPRNDIAHNRDVYPSDEVTDRMLIAVEQCLKHYHTTYY